MPRAVRTAILILAIVATLGVAAASVSPSHLHESAPGTSCDICLTAHAVAYQIAADVQPLVAPQQQPARFVVAQTANGYHLLRGTPSLTRGPPASSL